MGDGLKPFLDRMRQGQETDYRTPFWDGRPREDVISMLDAEMSVWWNDAPDLLGTRLQEVEESQRSKIGPMSVMLPLKLRLPGIQDYWDGDWPNVDLQFECEQLLQEIRSSSLLRARSAREAIAGMRLNTNSGYPRFTRRNGVVEEELATYVEGSWEGLPAILGWRGSATGFESEASSLEQVEWQDPKQRTLWMFPFSANIAEHRYLRPTMDLLLRRTRFVSAWRGPLATDQAVNELMLNAKEWSVPIFSTDFDSYDQTIGPSYQAAIFECLRGVFQQADHDELGVVESNFRTIPLMIQLNHQLSGEHGVPSGSGLTNLVDGIGHRLAQLKAAGSSRNLSPHCQIQGDDGLLVLRDGRDLDHVLNAYLELGLKSNADKQFVGYEDCTYLQRYYHPMIDGGAYPLYRALNALLGQERFHSSDRWGPEMVSLRAVMILENAKNHPFYREFVRFVQDGDSYRLGATWPGGIDVMLGPKAIKQATDIRGFLPSYNQEQNIRGLRNFETYKIIKESE